MRVFPDKYFRQWFVVRSRATSPPISDDNNSCSLIFIPRGRSSGEWILCGAAKVMSLCLWLIIHSGTGIVRAGRDVTLKNLLHTHHQLSLVCLQYKVIDHAWTVGYATRLRRRSQ